MTKRLIDIDDRLPAQARILTGATTIKETVNTSIRELSDAELRRRHLRRLVLGEGIDLRDPRIMLGAWR